MYGGFSDFSWCFSKTNAVDHLLWQSSITRLNGQTENTCWWLLIKFKELQELWYIGTYILLRIPKKKGQCHMNLSYPCLILFIYSFLIMETKAHFQQLFVLWIRTLKTIRTGTGATLQCKIFQFLFHFFSFLPCYINFCHAFVTFLHSTKCCDYRIV